MRPYRTWLVLAALVILGFAIYSNTFQSPFHFDDKIAIVENPAIRDLFDIRRIWDTFNTRFIGGMTFALNYALGGYDVTGFHLFNTVIHIINAFLVYLLVLTLFGTPQGRVSSLASHKDTIALLVSLLFLVHPIQTESVTYLWQRVTSLEALFHLSGILCYLRGRILNKSRYLVAGFFWMVAAMLTKEVAFLFPFLVAGSELFLFSSDETPRRTRLFCILPYLAALPIIPLLLLRTISQTLSIMYVQTVSMGLENFEDVMADMSTTASTMVTRPIYLLTQLNVLRTYLRLLIFPVNQNVDYDYPLSPGLGDMSTLISLFLFLGIIAFGIWMFRRNRLISFAVFWFLLHLSLEGFLVMLDDIFFEHRLYLPSIGFFFVGSSVLVKVFSHRVRVGIAIGVVCFFSVMTFLRNETWKSFLSLWTDALQKSPNKARVVHNVGACYFLSGKYEKAVEYEKRAIEIEPRFVLAHNGLAYAYGMLGNHTEMIIHCLQALRFDPDSPRRYVDLAAAYSKARLYHHAIPYAEKAMALNPGFIRAYDELGYAYWSLGQREKAEKYFHKALELNPTFPWTLLKLTVFYEEVGEHEKARAYAMQAANSDEVFNLLPVQQGLFEEARGNKEEAIRWHEIEIQNNPQNTESHRRLARLYEGKGDLQKAKTHRDIVDAQERNFASQLDTLEDLEPTSLAEFSSKKGD